jgi:hypothetical protein
LVEEDDDDRQPHSGPIGTGQGDRGQTIERRFDRQQGGVAGQAVVEAANQDQRPDAKEEAGGNEAFTEAAAAAEPGPQPFPDRVQPLLQLPPFADHPAADDRQQTADHPSDPSAPAGIQ